MQYYIIQVLKADAGNTFHAFNVWGRVGENGQSKVFGPYGSEQLAIKEFEKKVRLVFPPATTLADFLAQFKDKTKLTWPNRTGPPSAGGFFSSLLHLR